MNTHLHHTNSQGYVLVVSLVFLGIFLAVSAAFLGSVVTYSKSEDTTVTRTQALLLAEAGIDEAIYQLNQNPAYVGETDTPLGNGTFTVVISPITSTLKQVVSTAHIPNSTNPTVTRIISAQAGINYSAVSFRYGVQAGEGGFDLTNSSTIDGNVFSSGSVIGHQHNLIKGSVISAGPTGRVYGIHSTSSVFANTIGDASISTEIDEDAYYVTKINTTVSGTQYPNSPDQAPVNLPITDAQISGWENEAAAGGIISTCDSGGDYTITSSMSLGPKKIECNLVVKSSSGVLTITGPLWVTGNITTQTGPTIRMSPSLGNQNVAIIADNPSDTTGSGKFDIGQSTTFQGSGAPGSFVFLISQNRSAELGGTEIAMDLNQGASALVAYAAHGLANLSQSVSVREVTAYKIVLRNSANVTYDTGLPSTVFKSGPGASLVFVPGSYAIIQ